MKLMDERNDFTLEIERIRAKADPDCGQLAENRSGAAHGSAFHDGTTAGRYRYSIPDGVNQAEHRPASEDDTGPGEIE